MSIKDQLKITFHKWIMSLWWKSCKNSVHSNFDPNQVKILHISRQLRSATIVEAIILVPYYEVKSLQLSWKSDTHRLKHSSLPFPESHFDVYPWPWHAALAEPDWEG